jgi:iron complex outermembrane receptor protein
MSPLFRRAGRFLGLLLALTLILCSGLPLSRLDAAEGARRSFALASGRAEETLETFSEQAGVQLVFLLEDVRGAATNPVHGDFAIREALDQLIAGTGLGVKQDGKTGAFVIKRERAGANASNAPSDSAINPKSPDPSKQTMNRKKPLGAFAALLAAVAQLSAQPATIPTTPGSEVVTLSPFTVSSETVGRYTATESTSGSRIRVSLMDATQSITVITHELVEDVGALRLLDAAKYSGSISESTIPNAQDRTNVRGFQTDGATIDGFNFFSFSNVDPVLIDRLEIVKGPNPILSPQIAQGTINVVTKRPLFKDQTNASLQLGRYNADRAEVDVNRVLIPGKLTTRLVAAAQHSRDQAKGNYNHSQIAMPMFTYRFGPTAQVTAQAQIYNSYSAAYGGVPLDFTVGTNDTARLFPGISESLDFYGENIRRHSKGQHYRVFFEAKPTEQFSVRLALNAIRWSGDSVGLSIGNPIDPTTGNQVTVVGTIITQNPNTGSWAWSGQQLANPTFNEASATNPFASGSWGFQSRRYYNLQNDYVYELKFGENKSTTTAGYMVDYLKNPGISYNFSVPNMNVLNFSLQPLAVSPTPNLGWGYGINWDQQFYVNEQLNLFGGRLVATGGIARSEYRQYNSDVSRGLTSQNKVKANLPMVGIVFKPIPQLAFFADRTKQAQPNGTSPATGTNPTTFGKQYEAGMRTQLLDKRVYASLAYFDIRQNNFAIPNQANAVVPPPNPAFPPIFTDRKVTGVEFEINASLTENLSLVGNVAKIKARTPLGNGQVFRGVADKTAAGFLTYAFSKNSEFKGLTIGGGVDYVAKRPGDNPNPGGFIAATSTPGNLVLGQPTFYLPARTLVNVMASYRVNPHWRLQLNVDNVLDKHYLAASTSRNNVFPGTPINPRFTATYSF